MSCKNDYDISVIVPIFNGESYIDKCLSSILNQNVKKEIILVDDGSSDNSVEIIQSYAAKHDNVFVITQSNMHAGIARNAGIKAAHGKYVHFLDVDDTLEPNCYDSVLPFAISNQLDLIKVRSNVIYSDMERTGYIDTSNDKINRLYENCIWGQKSNFLDMPTDCPQRDERLGWTGDAQVFSQTASYNMDTRAFYRKL